MGILEIAGSVLTGVMSGGATGLIGIALQQWGDIKKRAHDLDVLKQQHLQTKELKELDNQRDLQMATMSAESAESLANIQVAARVEEINSEDYRASMASDRATYLSPEAQKHWFVIGMMAVVDFFRGMIRPGATIYSLVLLTMLLFWVHDMWSRSLIKITDADANRLALEVVMTVTYLVTTLTTWWFGRRAETPPKR